jgi:hypothetical protein
MHGFRFNTPPGWPAPPPGWQPPEGWTPDPNWPPAPPGWSFWIPEEPTPLSEIRETANHLNAGHHPGPAQTSEHSRALASEHRAQPQTMHSSTVQPIEQSRLRELEEQVRSLQRQLQEANAKASAGGTIADEDFVELDDSRLLQQVGIYEYHHPLENAELYRERLSELRQPTTPRRITASGPCGPAR